MFKLSLQFIYNEQLLKNFNIDDGNNYDIFENMSCTIGADIVNFNFFG